MIKKLVGYLVAFTLIFILSPQAHAALTLSTNAVTGDGVLTLQGTSLAVTGNTVFSGNIALGGTAIDPNSYIKLDATGGLSGAQISGATMNVSRSTASIFGTSGINLSVQYLAGSSSPTGGAQGISAYALNGSGFTLNTLLGLKAKGWNTSTSTTNTITGILADAWNQGTVTDSYALFVDNAVHTGTTTNSYGIYINPIFGTTNYGLYQSSSTNQNYFAGNVGIGATIPSAKLDVKDGHIASSQTTLPTPSVTGAGYSGASMVAGSSDTKGAITATVGAAAGTLVVTFNSAYTSAPFCSVTPSTATGQVDEGKMYITKTTGALTLNFVATPTGGSETWDYICIQ